MNELLRLALNQRKIKAILNVIFVGSITSYFFELIYFKYSLVEMNDYKAIYGFFVTGHFIIPFTLFYFCWLFTIGLRILLFQLPNVFITRRFGPHISRLLIWYYLADSNTSSKSALSKSKSFQWIIAATPAERIEEGKLIG